MNIDTSKYAKISGRGYVHGDIKDPFTGKRHMCHDGDIVVFHYCNNKKDANYYVGIFSRPFSNGEYTVVNVVKADTFEHVEDFKQSRLRLEFFNATNQDEEIYENYLEKNVFRYLDDNLLEYRGYIFKIERHGDLYTVIEQKTQVKEQCRGKIYAIGQCLASVIGYEKMRM